MIKNITKSAEKINKAIEESKVKANELDKFQEEILNMGYSFIEEVKDPNCNLSKDEEDKANELAENIIAKLRRERFDDKNELASERLITSLKRISDDDYDVWAEKYNLLKEFMEEFRHCQFKKDEKYKNVNLEEWVTAQRKILKNPLGDSKKKKKLNEIKIKDDDLIPDNNNENLNYVKFQWGNYDASWMRYFKALKKFYMDKGHCFVQSDHITKDSLHLGTWVLRERHFYKEVLRKRLKIDETSKNRLELLVSLDFVFNTDLKAVFGPQSDQLSYASLHRIFTRINKKEKNGGLNE